MPYSHWEPEVEFYEPSQAGLVPIVEHHITELTLDMNRIIQDSMITYKANSDRQVGMRVLGFTESGPVVQTNITTANKITRHPSGVVLGCRHPQEKVLFPGILRTFYLPIVET